MSQIVSTGRPAAFAEPSHHFVDEHASNASFCQCVEPKVSRHKVPVGMGKLRRLFLPFG